MTDVFDNQILEIILSLTAQSLTTVIFQNNAHLDDHTRGYLIIHFPFLLTDWVVKLGPPSFGDNGLYQYSVVTDNLQATLFVLARDVDTFKKQFDEEVTSWLAANGFTHFWNKPVPTVQNKNCLYVGKRVSPYQTLRELLGQE